MKTKSLLSLCAMALSSVAFAQSTYTDLYYTADMALGAWSRTMNNPSNWSVGSTTGETYSTDLTPDKWSNNNLYISTQNGQTVVSGDNITWKIHNLNLSTFISNANTATTSMQVSNRRTFTVDGDLNATVENAVGYENPYAFNQAGAQTEQFSYARIRLEGNAKLDVAGDFTINNITDPTKSSNVDGNNRRGYSNHGAVFSFETVDVAGVYDAEVNIGGNIIMTDNDLVSPLYGCQRSNRVSLFLNVINFTVEGVVKMNENLYDGERVLDLMRTGTPVEVSRSFGGIDGSGVIRIGAAAEGKYVNLTFTNAEAQAWKGSLTAEHTDSRLNVTMNGEGKQSMLIKEKHSNEATYEVSGFGIKDVGYDMESANKIGFNSVDVQKGTFELGGYAELKHGSLKISSSNAKFVVGGYQADALGTVNFEAARITAGTIGIGFNQEGSDVINFATSGEYALGDGFTAGKFHVSNPSSLTIELDYLPVEGSDLKEHLADLGGSMEWEIMHFESTNLTEETIGDIIVKVVDQSGNVIDGVDATLSLLGEADSYYGISATITSAVPEPATVAGIAGLLALAFAAYRRRR